MEDTINSVNISYREGKDKTKKLTIKGGCMIPESIRLKQVYLTGPDGKTYYKILLIGADNG